MAGSSRKTPLHLLEPDWRNRHAAGSNRILAFYLAKNHGRPKRKTYHVHHLIIFPHPPSMTFLSVTFLSQRSTHAWFLISCIDIFPYQAVTSATFMRCSLLPSPALIRLALSQHRFSLFRAAACRMFQELCSHRGRPNDFHTKSPVLGCSGNDPIQSLLTAAGYIKSHRCLEMSCG